jgi:hypothetical protein
MKIKVLHNSILLILLIVALGIGTDLCAQIKIGNNPKSLNPDAMLEIESSSRGVIFPRIELKSTSTTAPLKRFTAGMVVYNTSSSNDLTPGLYYCDGEKWIRVNNAAAPSGFIKNIQQFNVVVASNGQNVFVTPATITDANKILLYRNGVLISFTVSGDKTIVSELPCMQGDQIKIIQLL